MAKKPMPNFADFIYRQESAGQANLVNSTHLPKNGDWNALSAMGIVRGADVDDLFCEATLPHGWKKIATDHSMWSSLVDETGAEKASIFYKAAFYDRDAFFNISR
jgi:hypothetical protein